MAKANVILLNSVLWNLREITKLAEKIKNTYGDVECTSWRYPLTSCGELEIFKLLQTNRSLDNYTYILELTYDRLLYVFNLIIKYLESTDSLEKFRPNKNVHRPKTLSLASLLNMIWDRIEAQAVTLKQLTEKKVETEQRNIEPEIKVCTSSICTQSDVCSFSVCSCCEMVQEFVTQIVLEMEKILDNEEYTSALSNERKLLKESLAEITTWSAMSRWLNAIIEDFRNISSRAQQASVSSRKLRHRLDSGERRMKSKIEQYEEENKKLDSVLQDYRSKLIEVKQENETLRKEKSCMREEIKAKNSEITGTIENLKKKMDDLKRSYEEKFARKWEKKIQRKTEKELEWRKRLECESRRNKELEEENRRLLDTVERMKNELDNLSMKLNEDDHRCEHLERVIERIEQENEQLNTQLIEKQKLVDVYSSRIMEAFPDLDSESKYRYKASGNPQIDMKNQVEANKLRINHLQLENEKLIRTLKKMASMQS